MNLRKYGEWIGMAALLVGALGMRVWQLDRLPPGLHFDEAAYGLIGSSIRHGDFRIFYSEFTGREPIFMYLDALSQVFFGQTVLGERLPAACIGVASIAAVFFAGLQIFGGRDTGGASALGANGGRRVAWLAALGLAACFWSLLVSREGYRANLTPLAAGLAFGATWWAARRRTWAAVGVAGLLVGLSLYTYLAARFIPLVLAVFAFYCLGLWVLGRWGAGQQRPLNSRVIGMVLGGTAIAALVVLPLALHFQQVPTDLTERSAQVDVLATGGWTAVGRNVLDAIRMLSIAGSLDLKYNLPGRPVFDALAAPFFYLGLVLCLVRARRNPAYGFVLCWAGVMFLPAVLSDQGNHPHRAYGVLPALMLIWAVGLDGVWAFLARRPGRRVGALGGVLAAVVLVVSLGTTVVDYFGRWAQAPELYQAFDGPYADLAAYVNRLPENGTVRVIASTELDYPTVLYLAPKTLGYRWVNPAQAVLLPPVVSGHPLEYVVPDIVAAPDNWYSALGDAIKKRQFWTRQGDSLGQLYVFNRTGSGAADHLPLQGRACGGAGVNFNDDLIWLGWRINNQAIAGRPLSVTLYWQARRPSKVAWQTSLVIVDQRVSPHHYGQQDANGAFTKGLFPGDLVVGEYQLPVPAATPPGPYLLRLILYNLEDRTYPPAPIVGPPCGEVNAERTAVYEPVITVQK